MAKAGLTAKVGASDVNGVAAITFGTVADPVAGLPATTVLDAAMATLVADGASPTQAHVTAANTALTNFETLYTAYAAAYLGADVTVLYDITNVTKLNQLKSALRAILHMATGSTTLKN